MSPVVPIRPRSGPHLRHHAARRRAVPGDLAQHAGEGRDRPAARPPRCRRDRGRFPDHLAGRLRGCRGDLAHRPGTGHLRPRAHPQGRYRRGLERDQGLRAAAHPHVHLHLGHPHRAPAADDARGRQGPGEGRRGTREVLLRGRRVLADGRDARRHRVHRRGLRDRRGRRRDGREHPRHRRLHDPATSTGAYFARLYELAPELRGVELSVHCHDDLGMAVANSYAGLLAGARQVECAINGIGERAGNCSLEEIVMLLRTRTRRARPRHGRGHARARAHVADGHPLHRLRRAAEQGDRRAQRVRPRVRHPPGRRPEGALDLRDHGRRATSASSRTRSSSASIRVAMPCATRWSSLASRSRATR